MARLDPHSHFDSEQPRARSLHLALKVDFDAQRLEGSVTLRFAVPAAGPLDLDTRDLEFRSAFTGRGEVLLPSWGESDPILGRRLRLELPPGTEEVTLAYATLPESTALQWLSPAQTLGKEHPFLFSQCQAIHARSMVPLQDTPRARVTYTAEIAVPAALTAVMSAGSEGSFEGPAGMRTFRFAMPQAIPPYLLALAVGNIESRDLSPRSRIWSEPENLDAAAWEFAEIERYIRVAEGLFGPYEWDRYDMLNLPPSFPYGGMENPRLTFLTPTLLAGDRSLVAVVAHELAHSWTGNLVTNADADHFWLNEGFTVWAERRILEALWGPEFAARSYALGEAGLRSALARFGQDSPLTRLRMDLEGHHPDDAYSELPYEKGARFVVLLERTFGRERFGAFIREYIRAFHFTSITTEEFLVFLEEQLPGASARVNAHAWLYEPGLPANCPEIHSDRLDAIRRLSAGWARGERPDGAVTGDWTPHDLLFFLQGLPRELSQVECAWLDQHFGLSAQGNYEVLVEWLVIAAGSNYEPAFPRICEVLSKVGRMKFLRPLYSALGRHQRTRELSHEIFESNRDAYHSLSRRVIEGVLAGYPA